MWTQGRDAGAAKQTVRAALLAATGVIVLFGSQQLLFGQCCGQSRRVADCSIEKTYCHGRWFVAETLNFQVCGVAREDLVTLVACRAESLRRELSTKWLGKSLSTDWSPKCQILVHSDHRSYVAAAGRGSERTTGSSLVTTVAGKVVSRRIDVFDADSTGDSGPTALPHELTHVILKDRFVKTELPHWADEGAAILADAGEKQERHQRDLNSALETQRVLRMASLLTMDSYPSANQQGVFYAQSASAVRFLVAQKTPAHFICFLEHASSSGYDAALRSCYGMAGANDFDRKWRRKLANGSN